MVKQWSLLGFRRRRQTDHGVETSRVSMFLPSQFCVLFQVSDNIKSISVSSLCKHLESSLLPVVCVELQAVISITGSPLSHLWGWSCCTWAVVLLAVS